MIQNKIATIQCSLSLSILSLENPISPKHNAPPLSRFSVSPKTLSPKKSLSPDSLSLRKPYLPKNPSLSTVDITALSLTAL
ncbi:hypothetical protein Syun_026844 [Stephania yunnanensis]|uniref:Uncharacterized protein n=1 Tax=Stephania yunnanensis TaxID=152371 RepID=A0AAP0HKH7_9MAGN